MSPITWPKPSIFPWCSVIYALLNVAITVCIASLLGKHSMDWETALIWTSPSWAFNLFFLWAEYDDYKREKRNYDGWNEEMKYLFGDTAPKSWHYRVNQLRRPKKEPNESQ